jgi:hypothetical protein
LDTPRTAADVYYQRKRSTRRSLRLRERAGHARGEGAYENCAPQRDHESAARGSYIEGASEMTTPSGIETTSTRLLGILSISPIPEDHVALGVMITDARWTVQRISTLNGACTILRETPHPIVICEGDLFAWRVMLEYISQLPDPPLLIVTSRLADERLWAEALNLGAYDVLEKPFDPTEVFRIVSMASQHWQDRNDLHCVRTSQRKIATVA